eukprot:TRINITY_DN101579_c0_g1_i1.p1 TRINITY_DN101579_c0_g1~~TRINITY_DN101579_c0_g1_i1.p1  ORF type:complete len:439 (-),score=107.63 TRINITY_DN101579_c0_g1_i1:225-1541(-)
MAASRVLFHVCQGKKCGPRGGTNLIRDIEEVCAGTDEGANVALADCLGLCGLGPTVMVQVKGKPVQKFKGNLTYQHAEELVTTHVGPITELRRQIGRIKFAIRRDASAISRAGLLQQAFALIGGDGEASVEPWIATWRERPRLLAELLALRAQENVRGCLKEQGLIVGGRADMKPDPTMTKIAVYDPKSQGGDSVTWGTHCKPVAAEDTSLTALAKNVAGIVTSFNDVKPTAAMLAERALKDAERALELAPRWGQAHKVHALALEVNGRFNDASFALDKAIDLGGPGQECLGLRFQVERLEKGLSVEHALFQEAHCREDPLHWSQQGDPEEYKVKVPPKATSSPSWTGVAPLFACTTQPAVAPDVSGSDKFARIIRSVLLPHVEETYYNYNAVVGDDQSTEASEAGQDDEATEATIPAEEANAELLSALARYNEAVCA